MAVFPSVVGFGWIVFDGPLAPVDWAVSTLAAKGRGDAQKNAACLHRIETHIRIYRPSVIVLEDFDSRASRRAPRIRTLCRSIISLAAVEGIPVRIITRAEIARCFPSLPVHTRQATAERAASYLREIQARLPGKRRIWEGEKPDAALMNAAALLIVHYANPAEPL